MVLPSVSAGDNIVVIKDGKVAEQGTHAELLKIQIKKKKDEGDLPPLSSCWVYSRVYTSYNVHFGVSDLRLRSVCPGADVTYSGIYHDLWDTQMEQGNGTKGKEGESAAK